MDAAYSITLCCTSPSSLCAGTSSGVLSKRPSTGSPGCSYQPLGPLSLLLDWGLQDWAQILDPQQSHCRCLPSPRIVCSSGSWGTCRQGPSCEPKGRCPLASRARHGSCTPKPHLLRTWPSLQSSPYPGHSLGPLRTQAQKRARVKTSYAVNACKYCCSIGCLTIILLAVFLHVDLQISFDWFTVGLTVCRNR